MLARAAEPGARVGAAVRHDVFVLLPTRNCCETPALPVESWSTRKVFRAGDTSST